MFYFLIYKLLFVPFGIFAHKVRPNVRLKLGSFLTVVVIVTPNAHRRDVLLDAESALRALYVVAVGHCVCGTADNAPPAVSLPHGVLDGPCDITRPTSLRFHPFPLPYALHNRFPTSSKDWQFHRAFSFQCRFPYSPRQENL